MREVLAAFQHISQNAPQWIRALDDLEKTVKERQAHVACIPQDQQQQQQQQQSRKIKKSGSNESIRPRSRHDDDDDQGNNTPSPTSPQRRGVLARLPGTSAPGGRKRKTAASASVISTSDSLLVNNNGHATASLPTKYRSRSMIIVYYDSEIQKTFEQIVRHIGTARNYIRKAKMSRQMDRLPRALAASSHGAGVPLLAADNDDGSATSPGGAGGGPSGPASPLMMFRSTRSATPSRPTLNTPPNPSLPRGPTSAATGTASSPAALRGGGGAINDSRDDDGDDDGDVFGEADAALESAQSLCERGAHTFLREGDCEGEVAGARESFERAKRLSDQELDKLKAEASKLEPERDPLDEKEEAETKRAPAEIAGQMGTTSGSPPNMAGVGPQLLEVDDAEEDDMEDVEALLSAPTSRFRMMART